MPEADLSRVRIVLVEPQYGGNVGQCARAMLNMGLSRLELVAPREHLTAEAYWMAREAKGILEGARTYGSLREALATSTLAVGTTRRVGKYRRPIVSPRDAAAELIPLLAANEASILFGRENSGLTGEELDLCQWLISIPASDAFPSLNLAQAVLVVAYELFLAAGERKIDPDAPSLAGPEKLERFYSHQERVLTEIGFLHGDQAPSIQRSLRRIYGRAGLEPRDLKILHGILAQMEWYRERAGTGAGVRIAPVRERDREGVDRLVRSCGLPVSGLEHDRVRLRVALDGEELVGCVAVEVYPGLGLLRSLAVREDRRRGGIGARLVREAVAEAGRAGCSELYLLTMDAGEYFARFGFEETARNSVPPALKVSEEMRDEVCPSSATVMRLAVPKPTV